MSTHFEDSKAVMVDVSHKPETARMAVAEAVVWLPPEVLAALQGGVGKGDALFVAELAGIMAAKRTSELIPLCHPLPLTSVKVTGVVTPPQVVFTATCKTTAQTGVEMEALTAAGVAALTLYDMLKAAGKGIVIRELRLLSKEGGKSGPWTAAPTSDR
ncbi:MAG: cyclic pyranopterin monophosphate synthase MoaC [Truepera sp.]|nr:cyclic pyranopterin monophosphate synthase MoaC [Truepera sp.]